MGGSTETRDAPFCTLGATFEGRLGCLLLAVDRELAIDRGTDGLHLELVDLTWSVVMS